MKYLREEHKMKMEILAEELQTKRDEREYRRLEHEAALRNLNNLYEQSNTNTHGQ